MLKFPTTLNVERAWYKIFDCKVEDGVDETCSIILRNEKIWQHFRRSLVKMTFSYAVLTTYERWYVS
jgi:hypothetical protein